MKRLKPSTQYKKDVKRILNNPRKLKALQEIVDKLRNEIPIPAKISPICLRVIMPDIWNAILRAIFCLYGLTLIQTK